MTFRSVLSHFSPNRQVILDPLTIPLSLFKESMARLASAIIFIEDTSCLIYSVFEKQGEALFAQRVINRI